MKAKEKEKEKESKLKGTVSSIWTFFYLFRTGQRSQGKGEGKGR